MTTTIRRAICALSAAGLLATSLLVSPGSAQTTEATPTVTGCEGISLATPDAGTVTGAGHGGHGMDATAGMAHEVEYDLMYIDMMIPHHESIIALAEVAQGELTHPRLIEIAQAIVATQQGEIDHLQQLRAEWYGDAEPVSMEMMMEMPGMGDMAAMEQQMNADWQIQTFCAAEEKDLAFIDQVIPHHQMALDTSRAAVEMATHPELVAIAEQVIVAQEAEIVELETIRAEITGQATPAA